ncbi:hypothetical protein CCR85_12390 [Rhodothalassium salexigens]|uniref:PhzF family phenazine biosynthesis protein n=1 Tax=Rhodothalassium salexigens TaxID=1086 RepID=UPI00191489E7|nr:PhzF family phenazine biosynthesis protein [Rhodothalassium salexigens]MBK5912289.1 hypothetical protein [Rhodothalassium salexigens]
MRIPLIQVDAFTRRRFGGNPAAVCPLNAWLDDDTLQAVAAENNLSETAFFVANENDADVDYDLRWFTPTQEVDLCGHATLAAGYVIFRHLRAGAGQVVFASRSGPLRVFRRGDALALDFPRRPARAARERPGVVAALGAAPRHALLSERDDLLVFDDVAVVAALEPDFRALRAFDGRGFIATAPGTDCDFVLRYFAPALGVDEDPVTGSAFCVAGPYWAERLDKRRLTARQISARGGELVVEMAPDGRLHIAGHCVEVLSGEFTVA